MATIDLPVGIEQQLVALDRLVRDATFSRGISRVALVAPVALGICLAADWLLGLGGGLRLLLLVGWGLLTLGLAWREILRPLCRPPSLSELAALVERQHPELKERLTSLVELREHDAPGASPLMRDLLARQTAKAVEKLDLSDAAPPIRSPGTAVLAFTACVLLLAPFAFSPADYGLLWARLFAPWGNFHWGAVELIVVDGDRVVAKGSDVPIQIELRQHRRRETAQPDNKQTVVWLHWTDAVGIKDSRRLEWDAESQQFATTLPHVSKSLKFHADTTGAKSESHRIDVAEPPAITRLQLDVEPPAYTGLPARALDGAQGEVRAAERSRIVMKLEFSEPVASAELVWPIPAETAPGDNASADKPTTERTVPLKLAADKRSATVEALALSSGSFAIHLKNGAGLTNEDPPRSLVVDPDLAPAISLGGTEEPVAVRPDDRYLVSAQVKDDYGLTVVELHLESSTGKKRVDIVPAEALRERSITHEFPVDVADFELKPGQAITYRMHAVDNRPIPGPQETWTKARTLMIETKASTPPDKELVQRELDAKEQIADLRADLAEAKQALEQLHRQTEDESLKQQNSDKAEELAKLEQKQAELAERLQKLAAELAQRKLTEKLAERAQQLADRELAEAQQRLDQAKQREPRDQLQPISEAIDRLASVDKQLQSLDQQLSELNRLERDLAQLEQLARNTDRLAEKLEKLDQQSREVAENRPASDKAPPVPPAGNEKPGEAVASNDQPKPADPPNAKPGQQPQVADNAAAPNNNDPTALEQQRQKLEAEGQKLADELAEFLKKHPELLDAARRDQLQRLDQLAEQATAMAKPQEQLANAFEKDANEAPASAERPANDVRRESKETLDTEPKPGEAQAANKRPGEALPSDSNQSDPVKKDSPLGDAAPEPPASKPESQPTESAANGNEPKPGAPPQGNPAPQQTPQAKADAAQAQAGAEAVQAQQQIAREAARQALDLAQQEGPDSKATQAATEFAKQAVAAAREAQTGNLDQAAQQGKAAAQSADEAAKELAHPGQPATKQSEQAGDLAQRQQDLASQLQDLSGSKPAQQGAQQLGQQQLAEATAALSEQLQQAAKNLGASPLDSQPAADAASKAKQAAGEAQQAMKQAAQAAKSDDPQGAAEQAALATEKLQEAARQAQQSPAPSQSGQAIPESLATTVTQAAQQLQQAQDQLSSASTPKSPNGESPATPKQGQPGQGQPGQGDSPQGESGLARSAEQFRQAAATLRQVLNAGGQAQGSGKPGQPGSGQPGSGQPGSGQPGQGEPEQGQPGQGQPGQGQPGQGQPGTGQPGGPPPAQTQASGESGEPGQPGGAAGSGGRGAQVDADLKQLDTELKKQAQRNWGRLPGQLRTEILQGVNKKPRPEYAKQIKSYFEEIAKPATKENKP